MFSKGRNILIELLWLSLVGECSMVLGDGQGPPLGVLHLVVPGPLGSSSLFYLLFYVHSIGVVHCGH